MQIINRGEDKIRIQSDPKRPGKSYEKMLRV